MKEYYKWQLNSELAIVERYLHRPNIIQWKDILEKFESEGILALFIYIGLNFVESRKRRRHHTVYAISLFQYLILAVITT